MIFMIWRTGSRERHFFVQNMAEIRHLPQKSGFGHYLAGYSFHPPEMPIHFVSLSHEWNMMQLISQNSPCVSRTDTFRLPKSVGGPKRGNMPYISSISVPDPGQAISFVVFDPWVEGGAVV